MKMSPIVILAMLLAVSTQSRSATSRSSMITVAGMGNSSCGYWIENRKASKERRDLDNYFAENRVFAMTAWIQGYIVGVSDYSGRDLLARTDTNAITAWLDKHCDDNVLSDLFSAAQVLRSELSARQR